MFNVFIDGFFSSCVKYFIGVSSLTGFFYLSNVRMPVLLHNVLYFLSMRAAFRRLLPRPAAEGGA